MASITLQARDLRAFSGTASNIAAAPGTPPPPSRFQRRVHHVVGQQQRAPRNFVQKDIPQVQPQQIPVRLVIGAQNSPVNVVASTTNENIILTTNDLSPGPADVSARKPPTGRPSVIRLQCSTSPTRAPSTHNKQSPRIPRRKNVPLSDCPPPYDQIFFANEAEAISLECPSVLVDPKPRKEKKRSLRSRLLRHLTGKKAAAAAALIAAKQRQSASSSQELNNNSSSVLVSQSQFFIQPGLFCTATDGSEIPSFHSYINSDRHFISLSTPGSSQSSSESFTPFVIYTGSSSNNTILSQATKRDPLVHCSVQPSIPPPISEDTVMPKVTVTLTTKDAEDAHDSNSSKAASFHVITNKKDRETPTFKTESSSKSEEKSSYFSENVGLQHKTEARSTDDKVPNASKGESSEYPVSGSKVINDNSFDSKHSKGASMDSNTCKAGSRHRKDERRKVHNVEETNNQQAQVHVEENAKSKSYTINLKPGMYKLNLNIPDKKKGSQSHMININIPRDGAAATVGDVSVGKPPSIPEPLYYECSKASLNQRFTRFLKTSSVKNGTNKRKPKVTVIQNHPDKSGSSVITIISPNNKQESVNSKQHKKNHLGPCPRLPKKEHYRWAPLSCMHVGSSGVDETLSEGSGCDTYQGYEGVEHLKRRTDANDCNLLCNQCLSCNSDMLSCNQLAEGNGGRECVNLYPWCSNNVCDVSHLDVPLTSDNSKPICYSEKNIDRSDCLPASDCFWYEKLQKKFKEDNNFLKKVVEEYFKDVSSDDCDTREVNNINDINVDKIDQSTIQNLSTDIKEAELDTLGRHRSNIHESLINDSFPFSDESFGYEADTEEECQQEHSHTVKLSVVSKGGNEVLQQHHTSLTVKSDEHYDVGSGIAAAKNVLGKEPLDVGRAMNTASSQSVFSGVVESKVVKCCCSQYQQRQHCVCNSNVAVKKQNKCSDGVGSDDGDACVQDLNEVKACSGSSASHECDSVASLGLSTNISQVSPVLHDRENNPLFIQALSVNSVIPSSESNSGFNIWNDYQNNITACTNSTLSSHCWSVYDSDDDSLCSTCRKLCDESQCSDSVTYNSDDYENSSSDEEDSSTLQDRILKTGLIIHRSPNVVPSTKFDLKSVAERLKQLDSSLNSLSDIDFETEPLNLRQPDENLSANMNSSKTFFNTNIPRKSFGYDENDACSKQLGLDDDYELPSTKELSSLSPNSSLNDYEYCTSNQFQYENCDLKKPQCNLKSETGGIVFLSENSSDEKCNTPNSAGKPGRKRFAKVFQNASIVNEPSNNWAGTVKSELVIDPVCNKSRNYVAQPATCVSEYKIGDSNSFLNRANFNSNAESPEIPDSNRAKLKQKKFKHRKYFSGILDALGSATPLFRNSLASNSSADEGYAVEGLNNSTDRPLCPEQYSCYPSSATTKNSCLTFEQQALLFSKDSSNSSDQSSLDTGIPLYNDHFNDCLIEREFENDCLVSKLSKNSESSPIKKNSVNFESLPTNDMLYENVDFHKNLKKISTNSNRIFHEDSPIELSHNKFSPQVTTTAFFTLDDKSPKIRNDFPPNQSVCKEDVDNFPQNSTSQLPLYDNVYEDWMSCVGDNSKPNNNNTKASTYEFSNFDKRAESPQSVCSDNSYYYTAGANTVYEAIKAVRKSFIDDPNYLGEVYDDDEEEGDDDETHCEFESSDEATYNTSLQEEKCGIVDEKSDNAKGARTPDSTSSADLIEQLNALHEKYFGKAPSDTKSCNERIRSHSPVSDSKEGLVRAVPCVVLPELDVPENSNLPNAKLFERYNGDNLLDNKLDSLNSKDYSSFENASEASELDRRMSGVWTTGTGGDADEESCCDNSEPADDESKTEDLSCDSKDLSSYSLQSFSNESNDNVNTTKPTNYFMCNHTYSSNDWCAYCCKDDVRPNCYYSVDSNTESFYQPPAVTKDPPLYSTDQYVEATIVLNQNNPVYNSDSHFADNFGDSHEYENNVSDCQENYLNVPNVEFHASRRHSNPEKALLTPEPEKVSLLDDVMTCLGSKWNAKSHSPSPSSDREYPNHHQGGSTVPQKKADVNQSPVSSYRKARSGKPPVSPGSRTREGSTANAAAAAVLRANSRRRSRSASVGAKLRGSPNSSVARPASLVGLPRPNSLTDMVPPGSCSASQESLHSVSLMPLDDMAPHPQWLAERKKAEGNEAYRNKDYREALIHYSQAIDLCPDCAAYYSNRSACHMMLGKYREALNDAQKAVNLDKTFVKGWLRVGKCHVALGDGGAALSVLRQALELEPTNSALQQEIVSAQALQKCMADSLFAAEKKDYRTAVFHIDQALRYALGGLELRITKAEYLTFLSRFSDAEDIVNDILMNDNNHADALYVRGLCRYYKDNQEAAFQHFQKVLRLVPDHTKAKDIYKKAKLLIQKKEQGNTAFKMGDFDKAQEIYSEALAIDDRHKSTNAKLYCNRATVATKLGRLEQAIQDYTAALNLDEDYINAYLRRANTYQLTEQYEEAVRDLEKVYKLQRNQENKRLLQEAKAQLKRSKRKDYYKILGVAKTATDDEIKKAYRKKALLHHPDRHSSASTEEKAEHEKKFKELGEAYAVLTDAKKRAMHDRGQDVNDPECGFPGSGAGFDPNQVFEAFFGADFFPSQHHHHYYDQASQSQFQGQHGGGGGANYPGFGGMPSGYNFTF